MREYFRPVVETGLKKPDNALSICGSKLWFNQVEVITRAGSLGFRNVEKFPSNFFEDITSKRKPINSLNFLNPMIMGIVNLTPDSFSDGGSVRNLRDFSKAIKNLVRDGAEIIDLGGESTRPGSHEISYEVEKERVVKYLEFLSKTNHGAIISVDTRKSKIAELSAHFKAHIINDVSAGTFDKGMLAIVGKYKMGFCICHSVGTPETMNINPKYENVVLDVYDYLEERIFKAVQAGISKDKILVDPGIGFGKTCKHNLDIIRNISIFHGLGCPILLGVSRKKFIRTTMLSTNDLGLKFGSIFYSFEGVRQGVQIVRMHDVREMKNCLNGYKALWT